MSDENGQVLANPAALTATAPAGTEALRTVRPDHLGRYHWSAFIAEDDTRVFSFLTDRGALVIHVADRPRLRIEANGKIILNVDDGLYVTGVEPLSGDVENLVIDKKTGRIGTQ